VTYNALQLCLISPTYERWRVELVAALGRTSGFVECCSLHHRWRRHVFVWAKGDSFTRLMRERGLAIRNSARGARVDPS